MYNKGDLVAMVDYDNKTLTGIILDIHVWDIINNEADIYVYWSNGETYWCCVDAIELI